MRVEGSESYDSSISYGSAMKSSSGLRLGAKASAAPKKSSGGFMSGLASIFSGFGGGGCAAKPPEKQQLAS